MDKFTFIKNLQTLSKLIEVPIEEIVVGGRGWFILFGVEEESNDLNVWIPEKYLERLAKNEGTYYPKGCSRQTLASWFVPVAVGEVTAWIRPENSFYKTETLDVRSINTNWQWKVGANDTKMEEVSATVTILEPLAMMIEKRSSYAAVKRPKYKRDQDFEDIQVLQSILRSRSDKRLLKAG